MGQRLGRGHDAEHAVAPARGKVAGHYEIAVGPEEAAGLNSLVTQFDETQCLQIREAKRREGSLGV